MKFDSFRIIKPSYRNPNGGKVTVAFYGREEPEPGPMPAYYLWLNTPLAIMDENGLNRHIEKYEPNIPFNRSICKQALAALRTANDKPEPYLRRLEMNLRLGTLDL